jgi:hypothetical protein
VQRKLSVIVSADVVGYSDLMEHDEAGTLERPKADKPRRSISRDDDRSWPDRRRIVGDSIRQRTTLSGRPTFSEADVAANDGCPARLAFKR